MAPHSMDFAINEMRRRKITRWLDQSDTTKKAALIFLIVFFTILIVVLLIAIVILLTQEPSVDPETGNVRVPWRTRMWSRMRYGRRIPSTAHPASGVAGNNAQPAPATNAGRNPPNNDSFEEIDLARFSSRVETGTAHPMPMTPVANPNAPAASDEQAQGPPFLTLRTVDLSPRPKRAVPTTT